MSVNHPKILIREKWGLASLNFWNEIPVFQCLFLSLTEETGYIVTFSEGMSIAFKFKFYQKLGISEPQIIHRIKAAGFPVRPIIHLLSLISYEPALMCVPKVR